jgi:integrase
MAIHKLTASFVQSVKTKGMYPDGGGLYLQVGPGGRAKSWIFRYNLPTERREAECQGTADTETEIKRQQEKEHGEQRDRRDRHMGLGPLHTIGLEEARERARRCREMLLDGIDPLKQRKSDRLARKLAEAKNKTFDDCADEYEKRNEKEWVPSTKRAAKRLIRTYLRKALVLLSPGSCSDSSASDAVKLGDLPVNVIGVPQVEEVLKPLYETKPATALKVHGHLEGILSWAIAKEYRTGPNPAEWSGPISELLPSLKTKHHAALPYQQIGTFMAELRNFRPKDREGNTENEECLNALLLQLVILTTVRTDQARGARWNEIDLDAEVWTCPPERTKTGKVTAEPHVIYLNAPALQILKTLKARQAADGTAGEVYGRQDAPRLGQQMVGKPITGDTHLIKFLQNTLGRKDLTVHGFRTAFKSWQVDHYPHLEIAGEMALDHAVGTEVRRIYARDARMTKQRRQLMDAWGEFCGRTEPLDAKIISMRAAE